MTRSILHPFRVGPLVAALGMFAAPAFAQGTSAEREACTEDAVNLCSDTIPDVPKTTACMKAHLSQLSPRCRAVVAGRPDEPVRRTRRVEREARPPERDVPAFQRQAPRRDDADETGGRRYIEAPSEADETGERRYLYVDPDGRETYAPAPPDPARGDFARERARDRIGRLCDDDQIDPETCALTERALR